MTEHLKLVFIKEKDDFDSFQIRYVNLIANKNPRAKPRGKINAKHLFMQL